MRTSAQHGNTPACTHPSWFPSKQSREPHALNNLPAIIARRPRDRGSSPHGAFPPVATVGWSPVTYALRALRSQVAQVLPRPLLTPQAPG